MTKVSKQTQNWIATSQAPRNDGCFVMSPAPGSGGPFVIASEAWQSISDEPLSLNLGVYGCVNGGGVA